VLHEERVEGDPVRRVDRRAQGGLGLLGGPRPYDAEAVCDPVDVGVDRDRGDAVAEDEHAVRRLRPDPGKGRQGLERAGHLAAEPLEDLLRDRADDARLHPVEPRRADPGLDRGGARPREGGGIRVPREEPGARRVGVGVPGALGEDRADQHLERVLGMVAEVRPPPVAGPVERGEPVEDLLPFGRAEPYARSHRCALGRLRAGAGVGPDAGDASPGSERSGSSSLAGSRRSSPTR
jgi:hypothetical protein